LPWANRSAACRRRRCNHCRSPGCRSTRPLGVTAARLMPGSITAKLFYIRIVGDLCKLGINVPATLAATCLLVRCVGADPRRGAPLPRHGAAHGSPVVTGPAWATV
jgi:hypothetical protein